MTFESSLAAEAALCDHWLSLAPDALPQAWLGEAGEALRQAIARDRWRVDLDFLARRGRLDQAIRRQLANPADMAALLVLLWHGRQPDVSPTAPDWLADWLDAERARLKRLRLLTPPAKLAVTLVIPTYNRLDKLKRAVASLQAQSESDWQLLIGDDGSSDGTQSWCQALAAADPRVRYLRKPHNSGLADTINLLYETAETELIANLADDDLLMPDWLASTRSLFARFPWIAMAGGGYYLLHTGQGKLRAKQHGPYYLESRIADPRLELQRCGIVSPIFGGGMLIRKSVLASVSQADPTLGAQRYSGWDWLLTAKTLADYEVAYSPEIVVAYLIEAEGQNSFGADWGQPMLSLLNLLIQDYEALFGKQTYPGEIIRYFLETVAEPALVGSFYQILSQHQQPAELDAFLQAQRAGWEAHRIIRTEVLPMRMNTPCLLDAHSTNGLSGGDIPGLAHGQAPAPLQQLIQELARGLSQP
ncbi:MAG: hypothetical protein CVV27_13485 [Candidatus Melainabacteria bacterium HGW-Melainabacteria-1]|nr:MAG: hypothetical protein CVV27_13485 [Candidatus Melainabacteria bacterium HGW-Melainabacteria-1]